jgi:DNA polymerase
MTPKGTNKMSQSGKEQKSDSPLWKFRDEIKECVKCPLGYSRNKFVFGDGNPDADIMFIGEAPGSEEDRTGIPFVGRAGQLLNKLLSGIHIDREEVFIANILKCRPPNNRDPQPVEVQQCIPYLHKQIKMIQPKVIVALGRIAAQNLLETSSALKQMRERLWQYQNVTMIVTYHPAAILRNPGLLEAARQDFQFILKTYKDVKKHQI